MFPPVQILAAIGAVGRMMIRVGVLLLLFVAYQLWGTGLHTDRAQSSLAQEFKAQQEALAAGLPGEATSSSSTTVASTPADPATNPTTATTATAATPQTAPTDVPAPAEGDPIGSISIPDIGADFYIVEGTDLRWLEEGPGHFMSTPLPGQPGNAAIAGHRTTYKAPFNRIDELQPGALITVTTLQGTFTYEVLPQTTADGATVGHYIVGPGAMEILDDKGDNRLTLMACHPKYSAAQRIIVEAKLTTPPAPPTPRAEPAEAPTSLPGDDLAGGNDSARLWAVVFSVGAVALWFGAWYVGHRNKRWRWPAYAIALPFFVVLLFLSFDFINQLLPGAY